MVSFVYYFEEILGFDRTLCVTCT